MCAVEFTVCWDSSFRRFEIEFVFFVKGVQDCGCEVEYGRVKAQDASECCDKGYGVDEDRELEQRGSDGDEEWFCGRESGGSTEVVDPGVKERAPFWGEVYHSIDSLFKVMTEIFGSEFGSRYRGVEREFGGYDADLGTRGREGFSEEVFVEHICKWHCGSRMEFDQIRISRFNLRYYKRSRC